MAARLHHPLRGLKNLGRKPPNLKRPFSLPRPPPPPPPAAAAARSRPPSLPLSALRSLAQHLVSSSKRLFSTQPVAGAAPLKHTHLPSDLASRIRVGRGTLPGFGGFHHSSSAGRFGPGGLGRGGPMGPGVRGAFSRGVGNVGLGTARGYASMARPLFDGVVGNTPLALRALANALEDQAENLKAPHRSLHHSSKSSSSSSAKKQRLSAHPYLKSSFKKVPTVVVEESASDDHTYFFTPSPSHTLPVAASPSSTTTLFLPFSLNSTTHTFPPSHYPSLSHLASTHREAYQTHAQRVEGLIKLMEEKGVFLNAGVREEEVKDWEEEVLGVKVVFEGRSEEEVRVILGEGEGEGEWWFLDEQKRDASDTGSSSTSTSVNSLIFPTIPLATTPTETIHTNSIFASASNSLFEDQVLEERAEWSATSSPSPSLSLSSSLSSLSSSSTSDAGLSGSGSFISEFEPDEDLDDADWLSEYSSDAPIGNASSSSSSSSIILMEQREQEEMGTDLFSSAYWSEMGGNGEELR
ncbi:hypothetical protein BDY24DRAFT_439381 [Mrakia frigida]|uniref:uncharacterized protein n=1 Tax=Mrakia frigida TaxID=29902 RepID=UPI003FCBF88F